MDIEKDLKDLLESELGISLENQDEGEPLFEGQIIFDSISALRIVVSIEDKWEIALDDDDISDDFFHSIKSMADIVRKYI